MAGLNPMLAATNTVAIPIELIITFIVLIVPPTIGLMTWQVVNQFKMTKILAIMELRLQRIEREKGMEPPDLTLFDL